jgi:hypothetical protein
LLECVGNEVTQDDTTIQHIKPSMLTIALTLLDCLSMAYRRKSLKTQSRECLQVDAQLLEGSHHEYRNNNINEMLEKYKCSR